MGKATTHNKEMHINKEKLLKIMKDFNEKNKLEIEFTFQELCNRINDWGLDLSYKGMMSLLDNHNTWKAIYVHAIAEILECSIYDVFEVVDLDVNQKIEERKEWNRKYNKNYKETDVQIAN